MKRNNVFVSLCLSILTFLMSPSCNDPYCDELIAKLEINTCKENQNDCLIDMKNVFGHNWQYIYIFHGFNTPEDISNALGFEYSGGAIYDHTRLILLIRDNKVKESFKTECPLINLDRLLKNGYMRLDSSNSELALSISSYNGKRQYILGFNK